MREIISVIIIETFTEDVPWAKHFCVVSSVLTVTLSGYSCDLILTYEETKAWEEEVN